MTSPAAAPEPTPQGTGWWSRLRSAAVPVASPARPLLPVQMCHSAGETFFAVSLAGSLFFNVSLDAARPRILLYLALTMAPFAVLAPLIGPFIDRFRGGHRAVLMGALGGRALVALLLSAQLRSLLLYPLAFAIVVLAKVYSVSRNSLVPVLVEEREHLVVVNSRLARDGTAAGAAAAPIGVLILETAGAGAVLVVGALSYALGTILALRVPSPHPEVPTSPIVETTEMSGAGIRTATMGMGSLRATVGFAFFHLGFVLKEAGEPVWFFGLMAVASGVGSFSGTFIAPWMRRRIDEQLMLTIALALPGIAGVVAALRFHRISVLALAAALGLAGSLARRAFDEVIQTEAPHARRGQAYAGLETRIELGWVAGALLAVISRAPDWVGAAVLALWLMTVAGERIAAVVAAARRESGVSLETLPQRLVATAESLAAVGDHQQAAVLAMAAGDAARSVVGIPGESLFQELRSLQHEAIDDHDEDVAERMIAVARQLASEHELVITRRAEGRAAS